MPAVSKTMFPLQNSIRNITSMKVRYDQLQLQFATGEKAANLAEMGTDRYFSLATRSRISRIDAYGENVKTLDLRLNVLDTTMSRLDALESDARGAITPGNHGSSQVNFQTAPQIAKSRLDEVLTLLNTDVAGRYAFGGNKTESKPVASTQAVLEGEGGRAGFRTIVGERKLADLGADSRGRTVVATVADTTTLTEDGDHPFGFKLSNLSTSSANITVAGPGATQPRDLSVTFTTGALPAAGQTVTIGLTLPDGTEDQIVLTATTGTPGPGEFQIGADGDTTAANFATALGASLESLGETTLTSASAFAAADNYFNGQGEQVLRVDGPPFESATGLVAATPADTVLWYTGEDNADPRGSLTAKVGDGTTVRYGVQANESGIAQLVRSLAVQSVQTYASADTTSGERFDAVAQRNISRLAESQNNSAGSIEVIAVELGLAKTTAATIGERHTAHKAQLTNMLADIENADTEQVAMEILALKTRLEASYQTTSLLSELTLVNYLR
ncbi:hypothetical protein [Devosia sp.]|uniref:hypothetical protein n=1 Tax=Devosia sp. TaxID=1871048 RepID=UPI003A8F4E8A